MTSPHFQSTNFFQRHCGLSDTNSNVTSAAELLKHDRNSARTVAPAVTTAASLAVTVAPSSEGGPTPTNFSPLVTPKVIT